MSDHYAALGVRTNASLAEIKSAYRQMAARYHPDRNPAPEAVARFRAVQQAYEVLCDPEQRRAFDANRQRQLLDDPLASATELWGQYLDGVLAGVSLARR